MRETGSFSKRLYLEVVQENYRNVTLTSVGFLRDPEHVRAPVKPVRKWGKQGRAGEEAKQGYHLSLESSLSLIPKGAKKQK